MSLSDLASLGSFVSGFAVLISLVFLYFQLRQVGAQVQQAERNQQAAIRQGRVARIVDAQLAACEPSVAEAVLNGFSGAEDISKTQVQQFTSFCRGTFYNSEDAFYQHKEGLLNEVAFANFVRGAQGAISTPGMRVVWKRIRGAYGVEFVEFMDKLLTDTPLAAPVDALAQFKAGVAAEKSMTAQ